MIARGGYISVTTPSIKPRITVGIQRQSAARPPPTMARVIRIHVDRYVGHRSRTYAARPAIRHRRLEKRPNLCVGCRGGDQHDVGIDSLRVWLRGHHAHRAVHNSFLLRHRACLAVRLVSVILHPPVFRRQSVAADFSIK